MKNRIHKLLAEKKKNILSVYVTAGYPNRQDTVDIVRELASAGVDMVELGIPFSDPVADGPVIQDSNKVALGNGMTLKLLLEDVKEIRKTIKIPIILMGYINPVMQFGVAAFCREAAAAGVDGLILPDLPLEEYLEEYSTLFSEHGLLNTLLISPTTSVDRIRKIDEVSDGFIYAVSASSTTGARSGFDVEQEAYFEKLQKLKLKNPFLVGFGISNHTTFSQACRFGAGAIVGSAFIKALADESDYTKSIPRFVASLKSPLEPVTV